MSNNQLRIIFLGTPEFAVSSLDALLQAGFQIVGVVTAPDKPAGRGLQLQQSAVKKYALAHQLEILQPANLKDPVFLGQLKSWNANLQVVVAFRMLPEAVWNMPPQGTINLHGSLLPQYRGAAPINWAIINGEKETGVTSFRLKHEIDTGDILMQESIPILENETAGELHDRMKEIGARLLVKTVEGIASGALQPVAQSSVVNSQSAGTGDKPALKTAPRIHTDHCRINWSQPVEAVHNFVRGLSPYPGAFTVLNEKMLKVYRVRPEIVLPSETEGEYETDGRTWLKVACTNGYAHLLEVQLEGKKRMNVEEFLRGYRFDQ